MRPCPISTRSFPDCPSRQGLRAGCRPPDLCRVSRPDAGAEAGGQTPEGHRRRTRDGGGRSVANVNRRDQVAKTLGEIEAKAKGATKVTLELKIARAGLDWTPKTYWTYSGIFGAIVGFLLFLLSDSPFAGLGGVFFGAFGLPPFLLRHLRQRRIAKFNKELPNAVDVVVRGIKTGIPVGDCFRMVSREAEEPLRGEFRTVVETQALGLSLGDAVSRLHERVPTAEVNFFSIVINIQQQSGGNLSEALSNLSRVLRDRARCAARSRR